MNSPLGKYAPIAAFITTVGTVFVYLVALVFHSALNLDSATVTSLHDFAIIALGAIIGSAVAVNGWKQPMAAAHERIDKLEAAVQVSTHDPAPTE